MSGRSLKTIKQAGGGAVCCGPANTTNRMKEGAGNSPSSIKGSIGVKPGKGGYRKIKGAVSG